MNCLRQTFFGLLGLALAPLCISAEYSVVLGSGISNEYVASDLPCNPGDLCMEARYLWVLNAKKTVSGPVVKGRITALMAQHTDATSKFVRSVRLFVVSKISNEETRRKYKADYSLVAVSPLRKGKKYCLPFNPKEFGLSIDESLIVREVDSGSFCFPEKSIR